MAHGPERNPFNFVFITFLNIFRHFHPYLALAEVCTLLRAVLVVDVMYANTHKHGMDEEQ